MASLSACSPEFAVCALPLSDLGGTERSRGGAWRAFAATVSDPRARADLEHSAALEEANAAYLDSVVARLRA
ncbi:MAG: hypothetical protein ABW318_21205 [Vicinamibacterales bacterium]